MVEAFKRVNGAQLPWLLVQRYLPVGIFEIKTRKISCTTQTSKDCFHGREGVRIALDCLVDMDLEVHTHAQRLVTLLHPYHRRGITNGGSRRDDAATFQSLQIGLDSVCDRKRNRSGLAKFKLSNIGNIHRDWRYLHWWQAWLRSDRIDGAERHRREKAFKKVSP